MSRRRKQTLMDRLSEVSILGLLLNPVAMMIAVAIAAILLWNNYHEKIESISSQLINRDLLHVSQAPAWIKTDISSIAIRESRLTEVSLGEPRAAELIAASFAVQPWVKEVKQVRKTSNGIHVDLLYRQPVAIVEVGKTQLVPIDDQATVLDGRDFQDVRLREYWRVNIRQPRTHGLSAGRAWDDLRVSGAASIANAWTNSKTGSGLIRIVNNSLPTRDRIKISAYELWTARGTRIIWGNPPGFEGAGEAQAQQKIDAIMAYIQASGSLDQGLPKTYDVRSGKITAIENHASLEGVFFSDQKK